MWTYTTYLVGTVGLILTSVACAILAASIF